MPVFSKLYNNMRDIVTTDEGDPDTDPPVKCTQCMSRERLLDFRRLSKGKHICMAGQRFNANIGNRQVAMYSHHAIVKSSKLVSRRTACVTMIHFYTTAFDMAIRIQETTELLDLYFHEIYLINYRHPTHNPDKIIKRAEHIIESKKDITYSLFNCNCEHFCNWCCVGNENSFQVKTFGDTLSDIFSAVSNVGLKVLKTICKWLSVSVDDLSKLVSGSLVGVPWGVLGIALIVFLVYTIYTHIKLTDQKQKGIICSSCCRRNKQDIWVRFGAFCLLQLGGLGLLSLIFATIASKGVVVGVIAVLGIITVAVTSSIPRLRRLFLSPFEGKRTKVKKMNKIWIGDVIGFDHWKLSHDGVVSKVKARSPHAGEVTVIHYSLPKLFGTRKIVEETISIDLTKDHVVRLDYSGYTTHEPEIVVARARQRLDETKFGVMSNRSCHFAFWAKVKENGIQDQEFDGMKSTRVEFVRSINPFETLHGLQVLNVHHARNRKFTTKFIGSTFARIRDEVRIGEIVEFKYKGFWHKAVSTEAVFDSQCVSNLNVKVVHYGAKKTVCEETFAFDLRYDDIYVHRLHPVHRYRREEVVRRARSRIGQKYYNILNHRSSHLAAEMVMKNRDEPAVDINDIKQGDVITFSYWSLQHDAVVTDVFPMDSKRNDKGNITVVHYALEHLFAKRKILLETFPFDLSNDRTYIKGYSGYVTYDAQTVVKRAKSRIGEQRFNIYGNTSSDLAFWAKVVQTPAIVSTNPETPSATDSSDYLLFPKVGLEVSHFRKVIAHAWDDFKIGMIVEYTYYWIAHQGILSDVNKKRKTIKVIHYGAEHLFATRTVVEDSLKLDLRRNSLSLYIADPTKANKPYDILRKARARLGEQEWRKGNRSWDFCVSCVLNEI